MLKINLDGIKTTDYQIISLGLNCLPRTILTRWGLKPTKKQGELTMPFDLATFETYTLTECIKNDFSNFFADIEFKRKIPFFGKSYWVKNPNLIEFIHEKKLAKKDRHKLIKIYSNRIQNFRNAVENEKPTLFVQLLGNCEDVENVYCLIKKIRQRKSFKFVVIDTQDIVKSENPDISILKLKYPNEKYQKNWWSQKYYSRKDGQEFEYKIAKFCLEQLSSFSPVYDK